MSFAFIFPGQGSQSLKMMGQLKDTEVVQRTFAIAKDVLGTDFSSMLDEDNADNINQTINTQPLMLCAGYATYLAWMEHTNKQPSIVAGHSLGEWTALVASGVLKFEEALRLVRMRAEFMQMAVKPGDGAMAAVLGLEDDKIVSICNQIEQQYGGVVSGVNFNSPGQVVIAGDKNSIELALICLKEAGARKVQLLPVSVPSHCSLMKCAADKMLIEIAKVLFMQPKIKILHNVDASSHTDIDVIKDLLVKQLYSPVLWATTIRNIVAFGVTNIIECGPGKVLTGLNKRIDENIISYNIHSIDDILKLNIVL